MDRSIVRGPWALVWAANIAYLWLLSFFGVLLYREHLLALGLVWVAWFAIQEGIGIGCNILADRRGEPELARTYSQVMQWFANKDTGNSLIDTFKGWDLFVNMNCVVVGLISGYIVGQTWTEVIGACVGLGIGGTMWGHWQNNRIYG